MEKGMSREQFKSLLEELDGNSIKTLTEKNAKYSNSGDVLHNFHCGADIFGGTAAQACWGYLTKHLVALRDMVERDDFSNREDFLEKCQDSINYIRFLWCIGNEKNKKDHPTYRCQYCNRKIHLDPENGIDFRSLETHVEAIHLKRREDGMSLEEFISITYSKEEE